MKMKNLHYYKVHFLKVQLSVLRNTLFKIT